MKILYLNTTYTGGGAERVTRQIFEGMKKRGHEVFEIVCYNRKGMIADSHVHVLYAGMPGKILQRIQTRNRSNENMTIPYALYYILHFIKENGIDIVHLNNPHDSFLGIHDIRTIAERIPMIWTLHDLWALTGHCAVPLECGDEWKNGCVKCRWLDSYPRLRRDVSHKLYEEKRTALKGAGIYFVTPSQWLKEQVKLSYLKDEPCSCIFNSLDPETWHALRKDMVRLKYGLKTDKIILGFVAADLENPTKGMQYLLDALQRMDSQRWFLTIAGKIDEDVRTRIRSFEYREFGYISDQERMNEFYALADVVVNPSLYETFGLVNLEALASGTPVIAFHVCAAPEILDPRVGWCLETISEEALRGILTELSGRPEEIKGKSRACHEYVEQHFNESRMLDQYEDLYRLVKSRQK